ncbi:MAG: hypothetical protein JW881_05900 [Spirochaetales bacterium]|nr:hypothetical protein [Spirochaetales bacterium]
MSGKMAQEKESIQQIVEKELQNLIKATEFIQSFYTQIYDSIINLRDNVFTNAFTSNQEWKKSLDPSAETLQFPQFTLQSLEGEIQNNADLIVTVLNNIQAIENISLKNPESMSIASLNTMKELNTYIIAFIQRLYSHDHLSVLASQRLNLAKNIRESIAQVFENNINPYIERFITIKQDEYRIKLRPELKRLVGSHALYIQNTKKYDESIRQKCRELSLEYLQDLVVVGIADLAKSDESFEREIRSRYATQDTQTRSGRVFRLKEIANRSIAQIQNLTNLEQFLSSVYEYYQPLTIFQQIINFVKKLFTGAGIDFPKKDLVFFYSSRSGRIERRQTSVRNLLHDVASLRNFLTKIKNTFDFYTYTKNTSITTIKEMENVIDNSISSLDSIHTQCIGLRDWLIWKKNINYLKKIPPRQQEEFNDLILAINHNLIINKQNLRDMNKKYEQRD